MRDDPTLRDIALRARLEADLGRLAARSGLNPLAIPDAAARALAEGAFRLGNNGNLESASGERLDDWTARMLRQAPFFKADRAPAQPVEDGRPDYSKMDASQRLDAANAQIAKERAR